MSSTSRSPASLSRASLPSGANVREPLSPHARLLFRARREACDQLYERLIELDVPVPSREAWERLANAPTPLVSLPAKRDEAKLVQFLRNHCLRSGRPFSYTRTRRDLFCVIDSSGGHVRDVYFDHIFDARLFLANGNRTLTVEHTYPRARVPLSHPRLAEILTDQHQLFPCHPLANSRRGDAPFGIVRRATEAHGDFRLGYDRSGRMVFEPPEHHKPQAAQAMLYMAFAYDLPLHPNEQETLVSWFLTRLPKHKHRVRNELIAHWQGRRNPLIDQPSLVRRLF